MPGFVAQDVKQPVSLQGRGVGQGRGGEAGDRRGGGVEADTAGGEGRTEEVRAPAVGRKVGVVWDLGAEVGGSSPSGHFVPVDVDLLGA